MAIDIGSEPNFGVDIEVMAKAIASAGGQKTVGVIARQAAEAEIDLLRIREIRATLFNGLYEKPDVQLHDYTELNNNLAKLERYERRAFSRRKRALHAMSQGS